MPYVYVEPDAFMDHEGVTIFYVYDSIGEPWKYWFTTDRDNADETHGHGEEGHFDVRMFAGRWEKTPSVAEWEDFWRPRFKSENDAIEALIRTAIDDGKVK